MELANLTFRSTDDRNAVSDSELSPRRRQLVQGRNNPCVSAGAWSSARDTKRQKVRKKKNKSNGSLTARQFDIIDTNRTDFSKVSSDYPTIVDSTRTEDSGMDFNMMYTPHNISSSRQTPYVSADTSMDLSDMHLQASLNASKLAHGLQSNNLGMPYRRLAQSELGMAHNKSPRRDSNAKGTRRIPPGKPGSELKLPESAPASDQLSSRLQQHGSRSNKSRLDTMEYEPNPDVVPFQPANFMSSTILKKVPIPKRHLDTFGGYEYNFIGRRGVMLHTDRYQVDFIKSFDGMTQRERLQAGLDYMEAIRGTRRRREMVPHRAKLDLIMGGKQIEFEERFDIAREIQKLKAIAMPKNAKELFHGRGIHLPSTHHSLNPRLPLPNDVEDEVTVTIPAVLHPLVRRTTDQSHDRPRMDREPTSFARNGQFRSSSNLRKLPAIKTKTDAGLHRESTSMSRSHTQAPPPSREVTGLQKQKTGVKPTPGEASQRKDQAPPTHPTGQPIQEKEAVHDLDKEAVQVDDQPATVMEEVEEAVASMRETSPGHAPSHVSNRSHAPSLAHSTVLPQIAVAPSSSESKVRPQTEEGMKAPTPHPLRGTDLITSVPQDEQEILRQTFQRLDTDADGHLKYNQLRTQLPKKFTTEQEKFIEEVYNLTNAITFFGIDEFMVMNRLSKSVESLTGRAEEAYATLDFTTLPQELLKYVAKFDEGDTGFTGKIDLDCLQRILADTVTSSIISDSGLWDEIVDSISVDFSSQVSKVVFIAHIPLFLSLEKDY